MPATSVRVSAPTTLVVCAFLFQGAWVVFKLGELSNKVETVVVSVQDMRGGQKEVERGVLEVRSNNEKLHFRVRDLEQAVSQTRTLPR